MPRLVFGDQFSYNLNRNNDDRDFSRKPFESKFQRGEGQQDFKNNRFKNEEFGEKRNNREFIQKERFPNERPVSKFKNPDRNVEDVDQETTPKRFNKSEFKGKDKNVRQPNDSQQNDNLSGKQRTKEKLPQQSKNKNQDLSK